MKSKFLTIVMIVVLALSLSVPAFAAAYAKAGAYANATYYLQVNETTRYMTEASLNWGTQPIYILYESDGIRFLSNRTIYKVTSDDYYDTLSGSYSGSYETNGKTWTYSRKWTYPFTFYGQTISDVSDMERLRTTLTGNGVYLLTDSSVNYEDKIDFFRLPLLETMKVQQGKANLIPLHLVSWVRSLMPFGISCLVLLLLVPVLSKVLRIFLR